MTRKSLGPTFALHSIKSRCASKIWRINSDINNAVFFCNILCFILVVQCPRYLVYFTHTLRVYLRIVPFATRGDVWWPVILGAGNGIGIGNTCQVLSNIRCSRTYSILLTPHPRVQDAQSYTWEADSPNSPKYNVELPIIVMNKIMVKSLYKFTACVQVTEDRPIYCPFYETLRYSNLSWTLQRYNSRSFVS